MSQDYYCHYCHKSLECCKCDGRLQDDVATAQERIAELEDENSKLKVSIEHARSDALSNLERLISVEAENKRLREALREIMETDAEHLSYRIARRALGGEG